MSKRAFHARLFLFFCVLLSQAKLDTGKAGTFLAQLI